MGLFGKKDFENLEEYGKKTYKDKSEFEEAGRKALGTINGKRVQLQEAINKELGGEYKVESTKNQINTIAKTFFDYQWFRIIVDGVDENVFFTFSINRSGIRLTVDSKEDKDNYRKKDVEGAEDLHNKIAENYDITAAIKVELNQWCEIIKNYIQAHLDDLKSFAKLFAKKEKNVVGGHSSLESENPLNQILFGPPGTGKTYNTIFKTLDVLGELAVDTEGNPTTSKTVWFENEDADRDKALEKFNQYKEAGRIVFTTFHQSMNYEDFIEGIKPHTDEGQVEYNIEDGIFCQIAKKAYVDSIAASMTASSSVGFRDKFKNFIFHIAEQLENGDTISFQSKKGKEQTIARIDGDTIRFNAKDGIDRNTVTYAKLKKLDDAGLDPAETKVDKIGDIIGGCNATYYWTILNEIYNYNKENKPVSSSKEVQDWTYEDISLEYDNFLEKYRSKKSDQKPYVLIIDEINRGNVANIFGELITLIEEDKRLGNSEALTCTLPYSKKEFGVPSNLYIIGTMNTADRSVEALDSALRRRFSFVEIMPKPELLEGVKIKDVDNISLQELLATINKRIEVLKDREHQIGHSYFMKYAKEKEIEAEALKEVFTDKIIPLLQEYFYGDYEKIRLVLGDGFVTKQKTTVDFAGGSYEDIPEYSYQIEKSPEMAEALIKLMNIKTAKTESVVQANTDDAQ